MKENLPFSGSLSDCSLDLLHPAIGFVKDKILACLDMILIPVALHYTAVIACIIINKHKFNNIEGVVNKMAAQVNQ